MALTPEVANYDGFFCYADGPAWECRGETTPVTHFDAPMRLACLICAAMWMNGVKSIGIATTTEPRRMAAPGCPTLDSFLMKVFIKQKT